MQPAGGGWFETEIDELPPNSPYTFLLDNGLRVPDPAARAQVGDVHGPSRLIDPFAHRWQTPNWRGRPWHEAVIYELHVGTFTPEGTFEAAIGKLDHLADLGVTVVELMPVAQFSGNRGWGYDGVLPYAPHRAYGGPEGLKAFVDAAHGRGLMVLLDVVYNHFGPDGNYLPLYAEFFDTARTTPWGAAIDYQRPAVRSFFVDNALYWISEYLLDGLRLDAIDQIVDPSEPDLLEEIALTVRSRIPDRDIHLTTEDNRNVTRLHMRDGRNRVQLYTAEWNDDYHNVAHVIATGEKDGYYRDFCDDSIGRLARALTEGYVYQGEPTAYWQGEARGEPSAGLPPVAFIDFLQNHDQVGNRALGERLTTLADHSLLRVLVAITILSPSIPLLFMGDEWRETEPFLFFTDFDGDLARAVREGRRGEFAAWPAFRDESARRMIPDPNAPETFARSKIRWTSKETPKGREWFAYVQQLLRIRSEMIAPRLPELSGGQAETRWAEGDVVAVSWRLGGGSHLHLDANLADRPRAAPPPIDGQVLFRWPEVSPDADPGVSQLPGPSVIVRVDTDGNNAG